jgi:peptidoglycan hydrolase-like protein with peptidoglycan-binding domain
VLQKFLQEEGYLSFSDDNSFGYFGNMTKTALAGYENSQGISPADGYLGPVTRSLINSKVDQGTVTANIESVTDSSNPFVDGKAYDTDTVGFSIA